jgi:glycosyltransferase involved in cell wall biosynthesis
MTLEVAVDGYGLEGWSGTRGIGTYVRNLLAALEEDDRVHVTTVRTAARAPARARALEHELRLPRAIRAAKADVFHSPSPEPPRRCLVPWAQTLFDVIPLVLPDAVPAATRKRFARLAPLYRRADAVIAISQHAADEGVRLLGLEPARVHVVPLGVDASFTPGARSDRDEPPYVLVVGGYEPRKRLEHAFEVVARLADAGLPHRLHVAGAIAPFVEPDLRAAVARAPRPDRIDLLGRVDDLAAEYRGAAALLHTSSYEGFGLPLAEAMACGVPVLAYGNSSVPEVLDGAGVLVDDGDIDAFAKATRRVLEDPTYRAELVAAGLARAAGLRWEDCARAHVEVFLAIAAR